MEQYLAHLSVDNRKQSVLEHLTATANICAEHAKEFNGAEQGKLAGKAHDIGKYSDAFQRRLLNDGPKVDHATAGAFECMKLGQGFAAFAVAGHHGGLPDGGGRGDAPETSTFWGRINRAAKGKLPDYSVWKTELTLSRVPQPDYLQKDKLADMFFTRMLFSCLVDADYTDTSEFMTGKKTDKGNTVAMEQLWACLQQYISPWFPPKGELNTRRCAILERCIQEGERRAPGLYTLTVPTGGGKTVASLAFALAQAKSRGMKRVVYVIPYTSIIEQTADTFRKIIGSENVLEHHSGVLFDLNRDDELTPEAERLARATETWDMPVVVTTAVQFFESLFSNRPSQCRKLHRLAQSVIIFDEAQMLPLPYLRPCVWALTQLVEHYGVSALLCTATQPALRPLFREFSPKLPVEELCPMVAEEWDSFRRVTFCRTGKLTWNELSGQLQGQNQVLCIVNSRKAAQTVFHKLTGEGNFHLSTLMVPDHRKAVLAEVRQRLKEGLPCRVVSTSLIEAGVDVDFPAVFREEAGLDSVLQAAGRCNREGKRSPEDSVVTIFQGEDKPPRLFAAAIGAGCQVLDRFEDIASREAVQTYFSTLLDLNGRDAQDKQGILALMEADFFPFRTVAERFHLIDSPTVTVYVPRGEGADLIVRLRNGEHSRDLYRRLGQYCVSIYDDHFKALDLAGVLDRLEDGSYVLNDLRLYDETTGLSLEAEGGRAEII